MTTTQPENGTEEVSDVENESMEKDIGALSPDPTLITLSDGNQYYVERLRTRGLLRLVKILTGGAADVLTQTKFSMDMDPKEFAGIFIGALLFSIPDQEEATIDFIRQSVLPRHFNKNPVTPAEREANADMIRALNNLLDDPEMEDTFVILSTLVEIEAPNILSLGKRVRALLEVQRKSRIAKGSPSER